MSTREIRNLDVNVPASSAEQFTVEIVTGGQASEHTADLTRVACGAEFTNGTDLAAHMRILEPLRDWLEIHGALTPGSGVLVRTLPERIHPDDLAEERAMPGTVVARRVLSTALGAPQGTVAGRSGRDVRPLSQR